MKLEKLSTVCDVKNGYAFKSNDYVNLGYRVIRITNVQKSVVVDDDPQFIPDEIADKVSGFKLKLGDILISLTGNVGRVGRIENCHLPAVLNQRVGLIRPVSKAIDNAYLFQYLNSDNFEKEAIKNSNGVAQLNLSSKWVENHKIPLPPLHDQIRIAYLLSKVEGLIAQRKEHLRQLDDLLKSTFLEMFGIQDETYKRWTVDKLGSHAEIVSGVTKGKKYNNEKLIETQYLRVANVQDGYFILDEIKTITVTQKEIDQFQLRTGDLLLTEGGDPDKLGRGSVWEGQIPNCIHQNHIFRVRVHEQAQISSLYLSALVGSVYGKAYFFKSAKQTTGIASINSTQLKNFPTVIPPIKMQNRFAAIVQKVEGIKIRYRHTLADLGNLYSALSQKAFKGELDLSRVVLAKEQVTITEDVKLVIREVTETEPKPAIELLAPDNPNDLNNADGRKAVIGKWLGAYLAQLNGSAFSVEQFMEVAQQRLWDLQENEAVELGVGEYDHVKDWVFRALGSCRLRQGYDKSSNLMRIVLTKGR